MVNFLWLMSSAKRFSMEDGTPFVNSFRPLRS
jgi:hypothetical protein